MGTNGKKRDAPRTLNIFPQLLLAAIFTYFITFAKTSLPERTHEFNAVRLLSTRMTSAADLATSSPGDD